ncbi:glycosyl transferase family 2 [Geobacter metallireducens RCH3]|uniref:Glycosyltransferase n=1 Tax=Geobacter metallireducens (strain ATCC 53774 / DSM 7210 / GS-15) TaxID=269799 RepID=Q39U31_GEOMG|nr:glycosyltransferase family 2 protein [Geobacter metallireducens]ABB32243.1 glycosyltransferase [Geobacter metallireducens GS-15]EHP86989.1 glycosyl transferase family 2 [Geobacter metallireducens RCH3]
MNKVSVVLPTYNCGTYVGVAVESVLQQTYSNYELIIVNDGSTDETDQALAPYLCNNGHIRYIKQGNKGHAGARNTGIRAATGDVIAFIDSDDKWLPEKLGEQVQAMEEDPEVGLVHCNVYGFGENQEVQVRGPLLTQEQLQGYSGYIFDNLYFRKIIITTTTVMIRKSCIDDVGMFDENMTRYGSEDRELFLRILWKYKARYVNKPLAMYRNRSDSEGQNYERMIKGQEYVYEKITSLYGLPQSSKRAVMSKMYQEWAREFYAKGRFADGLTNQVKAIRANPIDMNAYFALKRYARFLFSRAT